MSSQSSTPAAPLAEKIHQLYIKEATPFTPEERVHVAIHPLLVSARRQLWQEIAGQTGLDIKLQGDNDILGSRVYVVPHHKSLDLGSEKEASLRRTILHRPAVAVITATGLDHFLFIHSLPVYRKDHPLCFPFEYKRSLPNNIRILAAGSYLSSPARRGLSARQVKAQFDVEPTLSFSQREKLQKYLLPAELNKLKYLVLLPLNWNIALNVPNVPRGFRDEDRQTFEAARSRGIHFIHPLYTVAIALYREVDIDGFKLCIHDAEALVHSSARGMMSRPDSEVPTWDELLTPFAEFVKNPFHDPRHVPHPPLPQHSSGPSSSVSWPAPFGPL